MQCKEEKKKTYLRIHIRTNAITESREKLKKCLEKNKIRTNIPKGGRGGKGRRERKERRERKLLKKRKKVFKLNNCEK